ncbi:MAG: SUMF1/EgtB/PvdO family nonheme iron enzyme [Bacteroidales bacterium]|nr:SUMF1/EgtB/PvdO family nonheme iron enzyme [Bacteroidales bacterium]
MKMKNIIYTLLSLVALLPVVLTSCDEAETGIVYKEINCPTDAIKWGSDVSAADKEVIAQLVNNLVKVEACDFYMGVQSSTSRREGYMSGFQYRDTIWCLIDTNNAYYVNRSKRDTVWYDAKHYVFADTIKNKHGRYPYTLVYKNNGGYKLGPVVKTSMPDYYIGKYEITQSEWMAVMHREPKGKYCIIGDLSGQASWYEQIGKGDRVAAYNIWYEDAVEFCQTLSRKTGLNFRLPTEAEWECAARGGKYTRGYKYAGSDTPGQVAWMASNARSQGLGAEDYGVHAGGEQMPNELGIYDMSGNVSEWVANAYYEYSVIDNKNPQGRPVVSVESDTLVLRGGSWMQEKVMDFCLANRKHCVMSSYETEQSKQSAFVNCGFRIAVSLQ